MPSRLTKKQQALTEELHQIYELLGLDFWNAESYEAAGRTTVLELAKRQVVLSEVVRAYTLVDEYLNAAMCHYFFGKQRSFITLWSTKKFQIFNYHIIEELSLLQKFRLVHAVRNVPRKVRDFVERLNALRNGLAHAFFPENLRKSQPSYRGKGIFSLEGLHLFCEDMGEVRDYFLEREFLGTPEERKPGQRKR
jgi:hypothetical protein